MWFSVVSLAALLFAARMLSVSPQDSNQVSFFMAVVCAMAAAGVFAFWYLLAVLLERRPALRDPAGRWVWVWALVFWLTMVSLGFVSRGSSSFGAALLVGAGWMVALSGVLVLPFSVLGRRKSSA